MILVKKLKFFQFLCLLNIDREKLFADVLDKKKKPLKTIKATVYKNAKLRFFPKEVSLSIWSKI